jgi:hypothetical protein
MTPFTAGRRRGRVAASVLALVLLGSLIPLASVSAAVTNTVATGGGAISADTAGGPWTTLAGPTLSGTVAADFPAAGTIKLDVPAGFVFNAGIGAVGDSGGAGCAGLAHVLVVTAGSATDTITTPPAGACTISFSGLQVRPTAGTPLVPGNITNSGTIGPSPGNYGTLTEVPGAPLLTFLVQPSLSTVAGVPFATQPVIHDQDQFGNVRAADPITLGIVPGTGTSGATLTCTTNPVLTVPVTGNAAFAGCRIDKVGTGYQLRATTGSATPVDSVPISITIGPPDHLVFVSYPAPSTPALLAPQPAVAVVDAAGNVITTDTRPITLAISANSGTFSCTGGLTRAAVAGVATFTGCTQTVVASGYTLTATSAPPLTPAVGAAFAVTSGGATKLAFCWGPLPACPTTPPSPITGGVPFTTQPTIRVQDVGGNTVTSDNTTIVTLAIAGGTPTSGGPGTLTCTGGNSKVVTAGVATFSGCAIDKVGTGYQLIASSNPPLTPATSLAFSVVAGPPVKLGFVTQPGTSTAGQPFANNVTVAIQDAGGNVVTSGIVATVALSIGTNPSAGVLTCSGGNVATTVNGVATFTGCSINNQGNGYTLVATATSTTPLTVLAPATSSPFNVLAVAAVISVTPSSSVITWGGTVVLSIHFAANGAAKTFTLQGARDGVNWNTIATLTTDGAGNATFAYRPATNLYYRAVFAGTADLSAGTSPVTRVVVRQIALLRPTNNGAVKTVSRGTNVTFTTTVRPARPELPLPRVTYRVYKLIGRTWTLIITHDVTANSAGLAKLVVSFSASGKYYVRSFAVPTPFNANSVLSPLERYNVN